MAEARDKMLARLKAMRKKHGLGEFKKSNGKKARPKNIEINPISHFDSRQSVFEFFK